MTNKHEQAVQDYMAGMKYKDIAAKYAVSLNTVKTWKTRYKWQRATTKTTTTKAKTVTKAITKSIMKVSSDVPPAIEILEANNQLTEKQKLFCLFYLQRFNATWAYQQVYHVSHEQAMRNGPRLMSNEKVKSQLNELRKQQSTELYFDIQDIIRELRQQSTADIRDVLQFKTVKHHAWYKVRDKRGPYTDGNGHYRMIPKIDPDTGEQAYYYENVVKLRNSDEIDTTNVKSLRVDQDKVIVEMYDKQKALDSLIKYTDVYAAQHEAQGVQIADDIKGDDEHGYHRETTE